MTVETRRDFPWPDEVPDDAIRELEEPSANVHEAKTRRRRAVQLPDTVPEGASPDAVDAAQSPSAPRARVESTRPDSPEARAMVRERFASRDGIPLDPPPPTILRTPRPFMSPGRYAFVAKKPSEPPE